MPKNLLCRPASVQSENQIAFHRFDKQEILKWYQIQDHLIFRSYLFLIFSALFFNLISVVLCWFFLHNFFLLNIIEIGNIYNTYTAGNPTDYLLFKIIRTKFFFIRTRQVTSTHKHIYYYFYIFLPTFYSFPHLPSVYVFFNFDKHK